MRSEGRKLGLSTGTRTKASVPGSPQGYLCAVYPAHDRMYPDRPILAGNPEVKAPAAIHPRGLRRVLPLTEKIAALSNHDNGVGTMRLDPGFAGPRLRSTA